MSRGCPTFAVVSKCGFAVVVAAVVAVVVAAVVAVVAVAVVAVAVVAVAVVAVAVVAVAVVAVAVVAVCSGVILSVSEGPLYCQTSRAAPSFQPAIDFPTPIRIPSTAG